MLNKLDKERFCLCLPTKLLTNNLLNSWNEVMVFGGNFLNHTMSGPFKVVEKALYIISSKTPFRCMVCLECGNVIIGVTRPIIWIQSGRFELGRQGKSSDGRSKGGICLMEEIIHMVNSSYGVFHFFHNFLHLVHFFFQVWYHTSDSTFGLVPFSIVLITFVSWILASFSTMLLMLPVNFSS